MMHDNHSGFTLLEILIALFIFTLVAVLFTQGLRTVLRAEARSKEHALRLHTLERALLLFSSDVSQAVNRPIINEAAKEEPAFKGTSKMISLTHLGYANPLGWVTKSTLARVAYVCATNELSRFTWAQVDRAPTVQKRKRSILSPLKDCYFDYLDATGHFHSRWPPEGSGKNPLPRAVKLTLQLTANERITGLYVIPMQSTLSEANSNGPS